VGYTVLHRHHVPCAGNTYEFQGAQVPGTEVSFIWVDMSPGGRIRLHNHPHREIFIIQEGSATVTVDSTCWKQEQACQTGSWICVTKG
jgi:quercetin dioxygenase-like cupin family protein